ncbi:MAG: fatty acid desaturase, partial [Rhodospirillaceae bacterium]|nr:fatty acid desaturase [Rhodospirillaceae bacterium]
HHLNPKIPNYRLEGCHEALLELKDIPVLTFRSALKAMFYVLWDEGQQRLVTFGAESRSRPLPNPV